MKASAIYSMTAFSRVEESIDDIQIRLEAKSLNHRHLEVKVRLPKLWSSLESKIKQKFQQNFSRGIIEFKAEVSTDSQSDVVGFEANLSLAADYAESIKSLQKALGLNQPIETRDLLHCNELITKLTPAERLAENEKEFWSKIEPLVDQLILSLKEMRKKEGESLKCILQDQLKNVKSTHKELIQLREQTKDSYEEKVKTKIKKIFDLYPISEISTDNVLESRISQELAILIDKSDIEEELDRINSHLSHFEEILSEGSPIGRKLEFMTQEFHREINTLGNKSQDFEMGKKVIHFKTILEQMREQILNVE